MLPRYVTFVTLSLLVLIPIHLPYLAVQRQWQFHWTVDDITSYSAGLLSYLSVSPFVNNLAPAFLHFATANYAPHEKWLFPGIALSALAILGSCYDRRSLASHRLKEMRRAFCLVAFVSCILSLGPYLIVRNRNTHLPLPYLLFYCLVPGFGAMRVPARFGLMVTLAASVLASLGFIRVCESLQKRFEMRQSRRVICQATIGILCLGMVTLEVGYNSLPLVKIPTGQEVSQVYRWLASRQFNGPIAEMPFGLWEDYQYMYLSTYHWLPIVNGSSGFFPPTYTQITAALQELPSRKAVEFLSVIGIKGLVVHQGLLPPAEIARWRSARLVDMGLEKLAEFGTDVMYQIPEIAKPTHQLQLELLAPDRLSVGSKVHIGMLGEVAGHQAWLHPRPLGQTPVVVEWQEQQTARVTTQQTDLLLPLALRANEATPLGLQVYTPSLPNLYTLRLHIPTLGVSTNTRVVEVKPTSLPTSTDSPKLLSATYTLEENIRPVYLNTEYVDVSFRAVNTGKAVWLARPEKDTGMVRLRWRWYKGEQEITSVAGRQELKYDVFPGQAYMFKASFVPPPEAGEYTLTLGLVSELVTWFVEQGVEHLKVPVRVIAPPIGDR